MKKLKIVIIVLVIINVFLGIETLVYKTHKMLKYVPCDDKTGFEILIDEEAVAINWTNEECKQQVERLFGNPKYIYSEWNLDRSFCSVNIRYVGINNSLTGVYYIQDLTHELIHLTEWVGNERYTQYRTFVRLYESNVPELHESGIRFALTEYYSDNGGEYDCWYYINEYLKEKNQCKNLL